MLSRGKVRKFKPNFYGDKIIGCVDTFCSLGVVFKYNNSFLNAIRHNVDKARKAVFKLKGNFERTELSVKTSLNLFHKMITPILLYGSELWGDLKMSKN